MLPRFIRNAADLGQAVVFGTTTESIVLDFKQAVHNWQPAKGIPNRDELVRDAQRETCRDIAQFANTDGGCLLVGVAESVDPHSGLKVATGFVSVADPDGLKQWIESAVRNFLVPGTFSHDIVAVPIDGAVVLAVNVSPSLHTVALWSDRRQIEYVRRTSHGKDWMNPDEVERHIMNASRATRLGLELAVREAGTPGVSLVDGYWMRTAGQQHAPQRWTPNGSPRIGTLSDGWFQLVVPTNAGNPCVNIPYGLVDEVWVGVEGQIQLLLRVRLILEGNRFLFDRQ